MGYHKMYLHKKIWVSHKQAKDGIEIVEEKDIWIVKAVLGSRITDGCEEYQVLVEYVESRIDRVEKQIIDLKKQNVDLSREIKNSKINNPSYYDYYKKTLDDEKRQSYNYGFKVGEVVIYKHDPYLLLEVTQISGKDSDGNTTILLFAHNNPLNRNWYWADPNDIITFKDALKSEVFYGSRSFKK